MTLNKTVSSDSGNALTQKADGAYLSQSSLDNAVPEWLIQSTNRNTMERIARLGLTKYTLSGLLVDEFEDETGVDGAASTGEVYGDGVYSNGWLVEMTYVTAIGSMNYSSYTVDKAFDGNQATYCRSYTATYGDVGQDWGEDKVVRRFEIEPYLDTTTFLGGTVATVHMELQGYNGSSWEVIDSWDFTQQAGGDLEIGETFAADIADTTPYQKHMVYMSGTSNDTTRAYCRELRFYETTISDMDLVSTATTADAAPDTIRLLVRAEFSDTLNTDFKAYASRDGGTNWTQGTLAKISEEGDVDYYEAIVDVSGQPSGTSLKWKITSHNDKQVAVHAVALNW